MDARTLTEREWRVVALVVLGCTNSEVAAALARNPKTVEWTLTRVYRKLGVRSRTQLVGRLAGVKSEGKEET